MSIEQKNKTAVANLEPASSVVGNANAEDFPLHPIADIFPRLSARELEKLAEDIETNGQREPGVVWNKMLLDGANRQLACKLKNIPFKVVTKDFADEGEAIAFAISANIRRRHLDESQRAMIGAQLVEFMEAAKLPADSTAAAGDRASNAGNQEKIKSREKAAEALNVSGRSIQDAIKVRTNGAPELISAVNAGQVSISAAAQVASLSKDEQINAVKTPGGVKAAAKKLRNDKKGLRKSRERKLPVNNLPNRKGASSVPAASPPDGGKNANLPEENKLPASTEQTKASSSELTVIKNRLRFTPNDAEIAQGSRIFCDASAAYPDCETLATRLLDGKHPGEAAATWKCVEEFASKMRRVYERMNEKLNKENSTND